MFWPLYASPWLHPSSIGPPCQPQGWPETLPPPSLCTPCPFHQNSLSNSSSSSSHRPLLTHHLPTRPVLYTHALCEKLVPLSQHLFLPRHLARSSARRSSPADFLPLPSWQVMCPRLCLQAPGPQQTPQQYLPRVSERGVCALVPSGSHPSRLPWKAALAHTPACACLVLLHLFMSHLSYQDVTSMKAGRDWVPNIPLILK